MGAKVPAQHGSVGFNFVGANALSVGWILQNIIFVLTGSANISLFIVLKLLKYPSSLTQTKTGFGFDAFNTENWKRSCWDMNSFVA